MSNTVRINVRKENLIMIMEIGIWITFIIINAVIEAFSMGVTNLWLACGRSNWPSFGYGRCAFYDSDYCYAFGIYIASYIP